MVAASNTTAAAPLAHGHQCDRFFKCIGSLSPIKMKATYLLAGS